MKPLKPPSTFKEQIEILKNRNLIIENEEYAEKILSRINYYRLSAYGLGLHKNDCYKENVTFETIYRLYEFDVKFRYLLLEVIEIIEVIFRTKIAYHMAIKYGSEAYLNEKYHNEFVEEFKQEKHRQRNAAFVKHHECCYEGRMPIWVAVEIFSFGMLSRFYGNMKKEDQLEIAKDFNTSPLFVRSWLKCLVEVRNICAHYGRIYNRILSSEPRLFTEREHIEKRRIFAVILVIKRLLNEDSKTFVSNLSGLVEKFDDTIKLSYIGFPIEWKKILGEYIESN